MSIFNCGIVNDLQQLNGQEPHCFCCGEILGESLAGVVATGYDVTGHEQGMFACCSNCLVHLGTLAGVGVGAMGLEAPDVGDSFVHALTFFFWQGIAKGRNEFIKLKQVEVDELREVIEGTRQQLARKNDDLTKAQQQIERLKNPPSPPTPRPQYVYLMRRSNGDCKIGLSEDVDRRHDQIRRDFPETSLLNWFDCDDMRSAEKALHEEFAPKRRDGEWFTLEADEIDYLMTIGKYEKGEFWRRATKKQLNTNNGQVF